MNGLNNLARVKTKKNVWDEALDLEKEKPRAGVSKDKNLDLGWL